MALHCALSPIVLTIVVLTAGSALVPALAANSGGSIDPNGNYSGTYVGAGQGDANAASVSVDSALSTSVYGGYSESGSASNNSVILSGSADVSGNVTGGSALNGDTVNNSIIMSGGTVWGYLYGGSSIDGLATSNSVTVHGGTVHDRIYAGYSENGPVSGNTLIITDGVMLERVYGGYQYENGSATDNSVEISGGIMLDNVYGGYISIGGGSTAGNVVVISNGDILGDIYGGRSRSGDALGNIISISGGTVGGDLNGGLVNSGVGAASGNSVILSGSADVSGNVTGGSALNGDTVNNSIVMSGGTVWGYLYGGSSIDGLATSNSVTVHGGTVHDRIYAGYSENGPVSGNTLIITDGVMLERVYGGYQYENGSATDNSVEISGGHLAENVYGGYISRGGGSATGNSVSISGAPTFGASTIIYGGNTNSGTGDMRSDNSLTVSTKGISTGNIENFQNYNFVLFSGGGTGLTLGDISGTDLGGTASSGRFTVAGVLPGTQLYPGSSVTLLRNPSGLVNVPTLGTGQVRQNSVLLLDYSLRSSGTDIWADIKEVQVAPENKNLSEGRTASLSFVNFGGDLVAGTGMDAARKATPLMRRGVRDITYGFVPFFSMSGSSIRYNTGSHVDVNGLALMAGLAKKWEAPVADILAGAFFESAFGSYTTHNKIDSIGSIDGRGETRTEGGGILARIDLTDTPLEGFYTEASFRFGRQTNDYTSNDLRDINGYTASYTVNTAYYGGHGGLGYIYTISPGASLDAYAKYLWTYQEGQRATILDNTFDFNAMYSQRTRLGGRYAHAMTDTIRPYIGTAWEHEFDGKARATVYGLEVPAPSLKGDTGIGEVGLTWKPTKAQGLSVELGVQGYVGMRHGVSGNMQLRYEF